MKNTIIVIIIFITNVIYSQEFNIYELVSENKRSNNNQFNLADFIYLKSDLKVTSYNISHFTVSKIQDTVWKNKKKQVFYKNIKINCEFNLHAKLNLLYDANQMRSSGVVKNHLIINSESLLKIDDVDRFEIHEIDTDSELAIQREINTIKSQSNKNSINIYLYIDKYSLPKPEFKFEKDSISTSGLVELKFTTSSKAKKIEWSSNVKLKDDESNTPTITVNTNQKVVAYYIDENGCKSNQDELQLVYKENCNCETSSGKPEILFFKSKNILEAQEEDEAEWEFKFIPEQSGSLNYDIPIKEVCGENFLVEVKLSSGKVLFKNYYERSDIDARSMNKIALENKNTLVFNVVLDDYRNYIEQADSIFIITIIPIVDDTECTRRKVISPKVRFSKCR
jgi:hypothetical protein